MCCMQCICETVLLHLQFSFTCSMQKAEGEGLGNSSRDLWHNHHMSSHLLSTAKLCTRPISHSVLATKVGQVPAERFTERMEHAQAKNHDSIPKGC